MCPTWDRLPHLISGPGHVVGGAALEKQLTPRGDKGAAEPDVPLSFLPPSSPSDKTHLRPQDGVNRKEERKGPWGRPVELPPNTQDTQGAENKHLPSPAIIIAFSVRKLRHRGLKEPVKFLGRCKSPPPGSFVLLTAILLKAVAHLV